VMGAEQTRMLPEARRPALPSPDPVVNDPAVFDPVRPSPERELETSVDDGFTLCAVGDCIVTRPLSGYLRDAGFRRAMDTFRDGDARFGNCETTIGDVAGRGGYPFAWDYDMPLLSEPAVAADLARLGFQLMSRANNHALDWNLAGMRETSRLLDAAGIVHAGVGERLGEARAARYLETPKGRVGLVSFASSYLPVSEALAEQGASPGRPGVSALKVYPSTIVPPDVIRALASMQPSAPATAGGQASAEASGDAAGAAPAGLRRFGLRFVAGERPGNTYDVDEVHAAEVLRAIRQGKQYSDFLIAALHTHQAEDESVELDEPMLPADFVQPLARAAIEAGADAFVTTGNHNLGPVEVYRGRPIFYGLGNFIWSDLLEPLSADVRKLRDTREVLTRAYAHPELATDADVNLATTGEWFRHDFTFYSVVTRSVFEGGALREIELHPVWLRHGERLTRSGIPQAPPPDHAARILDFLARTSEPYGTRIDVVDGVGHVRPGERG